MKNRKRLITVVINLVFIAAIAAVGWKIYDYVSDSRETTELAEALWEEAAITAEPEQKAVAAVPDLPADETGKTGGEPMEKEGVNPKESPEGTPAPERKEAASGEKDSRFPEPAERHRHTGTHAPVYGRAGHSHRNRL